MAVTAHSSRIADDDANPHAGEDVDYEQLSADDDTFVIALAIDTGNGHTFQTTDDHKWQWRREGGGFADITDATGEIRYNNDSVQDHDITVAPGVRLTTGGTYVASGKKFNQQAILNFDAIVPNNNVTEMWAAITVANAAAGVEYEFRVSGKATPDIPNGNTFAVVVPAKLIVEVPVIGPTGIASAEAFGSPVLDILPDGKASDETFGSLVLDLIPTGIVTSEAHGSLVLDILPTGITSSETHGTLVLDLLPTGIISSEAFGAPSVTDVTIRPTGISTLEAFGILLIMGEGLLQDAGPLNRQTALTPEITTAISVDYSAQAEIDYLVALSMEKILTPSIDMDSAISKDLDLASISELTTNPTLPIETTDTQDRGTSLDIDHKSSKDVEI